MVKNGLIHKTMAPKQFLCFYLFALLKIEFAWIKVHMLYSEVESTPIKRGHIIPTKRQTQSKLLGLVILQSWQAATSQWSICRLNALHTTKNQIRTLWKPRKKIIISTSSNPIDPPLFPLTFRLGTLMVTNWRHAYMVVVGNIVIIKLKCWLF